MEFQECDKCSKKPGSPTLCKGCSHNRYYIGTLESQIERQQGLQTIIKELLKITK